MGEGVRRGAQGMGGAGRASLQRNEEWLGDGYFHHADFCVVSLLYKYVKIYQIIKCKFVQFITC